MFKNARTQIVSHAPSEDTGARAVEVAAMLGDSVVHVKHCMDPKGGKVTTGTWMLAALSAVSLLGAAGAIKSSIDTAASNADALRTHINVKKRPAYSFRPLQQSKALELLAFGGLGIGLAAAVTALVRARSERRSPLYRVGTAPGVELALATAPAAEFPLVAPQGDEFVFNFGAGFEGDLTVGGTTTPLAELAQSGRARPSASTAGAIEIPIPPHARIRARSGNTTFIVSSVARPSAQALAGFAGGDRKTFAYIAGSLAVHLGVWGILQGIPEEQAGVTLNLNETESVTARIEGATQEEVPPEEEPDTGADTGADGGNNGAPSMALPEGAAGKPDAKQADGRMEVKDNQRDPAMARIEAIEAARTAGIMGSTIVRDSIASLAGTESFSSGFEGANVYGPMFGASGEGKGNFGMGRMGVGLGGGCDASPMGGCSSIISAGRYGTIPGGRGTGSEYGFGPGGGPGGRRHVAQIPTGFIGRPTETGSMDKEIIRRYIKRKAEALSYCYEKQLLASPGLAGTVNAQFMISADGTVQGARASGLGEVGSCVAGVIGSIKFPAPKDGGIVQVTYPFNFHAAGS